MVASTWTDADTARALQFWSEYQQQHDISSLIGKAAGVDPITGQVWIGESAAEISRQLENEGNAKALYFVRVGFDHYIRKGVHR